MKFRQGHNFSLSKVFAKLEFNELQNYPSSRFRRNWQSRDRKSLENQHPYWLRCSRPNRKKVEKVIFCSSSKEETFDIISQNSYSSSGLHPNIILPPTPRHIFPWETKTCHSSFTSTTSAEQEFWKMKVYEQTFGNDIKIRFLWRTAVVSSYVHKEWLRRAVALSKDRSETCFTQWVLPASQLSQWK